MDDARIGSTLDRYRIEALLGRGGFGSVYRARHQVLGRAVALKVLHPRAAEDAGVVERFLEEAKAASAIGSAHIVEVFDAGGAGGEVFLAMELLDGEDLARRIARRGPLPEAEAIAIGLEILDALAAAHAAGIVHRDLKPANVFLARDGAGRERAKLLDFGISKVSHPAGRARARTAEGEVLGTPLYMAPEQLRSAGETDARADLWSWGAMVLEMISMRTPYEAESFEALVVKRLTEPPRSVDELAPAASAALRRLLSDCLALDPADRPPSAAAIAQGLRAAQLPATIARAAPITREHPLAPDTVPDATAGAVPEAVATTRVARAPASAALRHAPSLLALALPIAISSACLFATAGALVLERASAPVAAPPPPPAPAPVAQDDEEAVLGFALRMIERSLGVPAAAAPARPTVTVLTIDPPRLDGSLDPTAIEGLIARARPAIAACARQGAGDDVAVQLIATPGSATIVQPQPFYPATDAGVAACAAGAIATAAGEDATASYGQGVAAIAMRLPPR